MAVSVLWLSAAALAQAPAAPPAPAAPAAAADGSPPTWAVWTPKELRFIYMGFTAHYSCDGLADKMRKILLQLGARSDMKISAVPCSGPLGTPTEFPGVTVKMNVLTLWDSATASAATTPVPAHWKLVELSTERDPLYQAGDCELVEQVKAHVLPLFRPRHVDYHSNCIPYQLQMGAAQLKADVLFADDQGARTPASKPPAPPAAAPPAPR